MTIIDKVRDKLEEYEMKIFSDYPVEDSEHVFYVENMILFVGLLDNSIGISFQATIPPERAANIALILNEIGLELDVMESFIYDKDNKCITGSKAFDLIENTKKATAVQEFIKQQSYNQLLSSTKCYKC